MASKRKRLDKRTLYIVGAALGVEVLVCAGLVMSVHTKKAAMEQTLTGKETALSNVRTVSAGLPGLHAQYEKMVAQVRNLEEGLPPAEYIPTLLGDIEQTAIASGVRIVEFRPKAVPPSTGSATTETTTSGCTQQMFDMTVTGSYGHIQKYLQSLTRFRKILALNSIKMQPTASSKAKTSPDLTATLSLTAYVLPPVAPGVPGAPNMTAAMTSKPETASAAAPAAAKMAAKQGISVPQAAARG